MKGAEDGEGLWVSFGICPPLALSGRDGHGDGCLLVGVKQTQCGHAVTPPIDPKRTLGRSL